jgi:hypothetical protein
MKAIAESAGDRYRIFLDDWSVAAMNIPHILQNEFCGVSRRLSVLHQFRTRTWPSYSNNRLDGSIGQLAQDRKWRSFADSSWGIS